MKEIKKINQINMKLEITIYQLKSNPDIGFSIHEVSGKNTSVSLWKDNYEGGYAYDSDWEFIDEFKSKEKAMEFILGFGEVIKIEI